MSKSAKSLQGTENKAVASKHNSKDDNVPGRVRALEECGGKLMNYITIYLFKFKVIIGTSDAGGVFRKTPARLCGGDELPGPI